MERKDALEKWRVRNVRTFSVSGAMPAGASDRVLVVDGPIVPQGFHWLVPLVTLETFSAYGVGLTVLLWICICDASKARPLGPNFAPPPTPAQGGINDTATTFDLTARYPFTLIADEDPFQLVPAGTFCRAGTAAGGGKGNEIFVPQNHYLRGIYNGTGTGGGVATPPFPPAGSIITLAAQNIEEIENDSLESCL